MTDEKKEYQTPLTLREKLALQILLVMFKVVKSADFYADEYLKKIKEYAELT